MSVPSSTPAKDWNALRKRLKKLGCTFTDTAGSHIQVHYNGRIVGMTQRTGTSIRAYRNAIALLRRNGVPLQ